MCQRRQNADILTFDFVCAGISHSASESVLLHATPSIIANRGLDLKPSGRQHGRSPSKKGPRNMLLCRTPGTFSGFLPPLDRGFLLPGGVFRRFAGHPIRADSGLAVNRPIRSWVCRKSALRAVSSGIWNTTYPECLITLAPSLISFSRCARRNHFITDLGNVRQLRTVP